jgi:hypothetical protein
VLRARPCAALRACSAVPVLGNQRVARTWTQAQKWPLSRRTVQPVTHHTRND